MGRNNNNLTISKIVIVSFILFSFIIQHVQALYPCSITTDNSVQIQSLVATAPSNSNTPYVICFLPGVYTLTQRVIIDKIVIFQGPLAATDPTPTKNYGSNLRNPLDSSAEAIIDLGGNGFDPAFQISSSGVIFDGLVF